MKIFPPQSNDQSTRTENAKPSKNGPSRKKLPPPEKKQISASDIKEKLAAHGQTPEAEKLKPIKSSQKFGEGFMNEAIVRPPIVVPLEEEITPGAAEAKKDHLLKSDIAQNDPTDTNTQEKLKTVLSKGAFNFNPKEKELLEKILS